MLTLTENASTIVRDITEQTEAGDLGGLRITAEPVEEAAPEPAFAISAAQGPQPGDATVEQDGATVYLDQSRPSSSTTRCSTPASTRPATSSSP